MREKDFLIYNRDYRVHIKGGHLWKIPPREDQEGIIDFDEQSKQLSIFLCPNSEFEDVQSELHKITKKLNPVFFFLLWIQQRLPSLLLLLPITFTVLFFGYMTVYGDLIINWAFLGENSMTVFGLPMNQAAIVTGLIAILFIYFFPVIFSGEQEGFIQALNDRFSNRDRLRKRLALTTRFLRSREHITSVELWNLDLSQEFLDWIQRSLIPALFDVELQMTYHIRIDERYLLTNYIHEIVGKELEWEEQPIEQDDKIIPYTISYEYLENWEKSMLTVYVYASTASLSPRWLLFKGTESEGFLNNVVSLRMVKIIFDHFKERLFSEEDQKKLISPDLFASRCVNDYGILLPVLRYDNTTWVISEEVVKKELETVKREMHFLDSFLQAEMGQFTQSLDDPVTAIKLNCIQENNSIYTTSRLEAIRFFVQVTSKAEQYKILKRYWHLITHNPEDDIDLSEEIYRVIGVDLLFSLTTIFERAAMYDHAASVLDYVERISPIRGKMGKARLLECKGNFNEAIGAMLEIRNDWKQNDLQLTVESIVDLHLDMAWTIVSGRLETHRLLGREACKDADKALKRKFDAVRDSNRIFRLYNVLANYEEWEGSLQGALDNYEKALKIPGVHQAKLSSALVNKGIALRCLKRFRESIPCIEKGVEMKLAIGDEDQSPIALHNLAQTYIELAFSISNKDDQKVYFSKAVEHARRGLHIQEQTGSIKKRGQLLAEAFIGEFKLTKLGEKTDSTPALSLKAVQDWLMTESKEGRATTYDCEVVISELLGNLEDFQGNCLEEVVARKI